MAVHEGDPCTLSALFSLFSARRRSLHYTPSGPSLSPSHTRIEAPGPGMLGSPVKSVVVDAICVASAVHLHSHCQTAMCHFVQRQSLFAQITPSVTRSVQRTGKSLCNLFRSTAIHSHLATQESQYAEAGFWGVRRTAKSRALRLRRSDRWHAPHYPLSMALFA